MLGGGGFLGYQYYRSQQVAQAKQEAEGMRTRGEYDQAITHLETAFGEHPEAPDLVTLRDSIEAQKVNELVDGFRKQATQCRLDKNYSGEAKAYEDAENLLAQHKGLAGVKQDATLASSRKRAEDLHQFTLFMAEGKAAEDEKRYDAAEKAYQEAVKFETMGEGKAQQAATRAKFKGLVAQAEAMETSRDYPQALTLLEQAAKLNVQDVTRLKDRVNKAMNYERHLTDALKMQESGDLRGAAETFAKAMRYAASDEEADRLRERADALGVEANFKDQVTAGERAMAERRWKEA